MSVKKEIKMSKTANVVIDLSQYLNVYRFSAELPGSGVKVNFKPISTFMLKELVSFDGDPDDALDKLINSCVTDDGFEVKDLTLQDRFFLLVELRKRSKGSEYNINYDCVSCNGQVIDVINLDNLKVTKLSDTTIDYKVKLDDNITVELKLITRNTGIQASKLSEEFIKSGKYKQSNKTLDDTILSYLLSIVSINTPSGNIDNPDINQILLLFEQGPSFFYDRIVKWYESLDFGVEFKIDLICPHCSKKEKIEVPLENFFS
jgi:hypothetical protein